MPFGIAQEGDQLYNLIISDISEYWRVYNRHMKNENYFSQDFIELLSKMLSPNPSDRFTIDQIKDSNFYKGSVATIEEV